MNDPITDLDINSKAQLSILKACRKNNPDVRIVFASTRQIYGKPKYLPVDELHPLQPVDVNGINKIAGEQYHILYYEVYGILSSVLRLTNTYGPKMRIKDARQTFLGIWIRNLLEGKPIQIFGDGKQRRDYNYVDDVLDALIAATSDDAIGKAYNLDAPNPLSLEKTAKLMCDKVENGNANSCLFLRTVKPLCGDFICDYSTFSNSFGWHPKISFEEGIIKSINFYKEEIKYYT